jgi:protein-L-isoaspartate(D-aspartate) O-methyltransferase
MPGTAVDRMEFQLSLRRRGIADAATLRAMDEVPRDLFVPEDQIAEAHADRALPIACGQTISQPYVVAFMTEALRLQPTHRVLEVGTGSGYQTAILARIAREVVSLERYRTLIDAARWRLDRLGIVNVTLIQADGSAGHAAGAPYDRVLVTCAVEAVPPALIDQVADGGILVAPVGPTGGTQQITRITRRDGQTTTETLLPVRFVPLVRGIAQEL